MRNQFALLALVAALTAGVACRGSEEEAALPAMLKARFETEMKTILHDLKLAEETANALTGQYLELQPLQSQYFNRPVPETYDLQLTDVSGSGYRAVITHRASGISCRLEVETGEGRGVPICG